jgi:Zn-finger nucleic acid-binding protein
MHCCFQCGGLFLDGATSKRVVDALDPLAVAASDHASRHARANVATEAIAPCPVCSKPLDRMPIEAAGVTVDVCREHGVWFDRDELHRVVRAVAPSQAAPVASAPLPAGMAPGQYVAPGWIDQSAQKPFGGMPSLGTPVGQQQSPGGDQPWSTGKKVAVVGAGVAAVAGVAYLASNKDGFGAIGQTLSKLF